MKKLIFTKGDETRPKLENLKDEKILKDSIFADIYDSAFSLIKEISESTKEQNNKNNRERNNIIAFIGERGSGKTSCLKSIYFSLDKQQGKPLPIPINEVNISYNNQLPIIDPSYIDEQSNIIEIVIAHMFSTFKKDVNGNRCSFEGDNLGKKRELVKKFQNVKEALDCTKARDPRSASNDSIEQLSKLASGSNLHNSMEELVTCYLNYFKSENNKTQQMLVIAIDDLDVQTNHTYQMIEQIRKYLIIDNVIILIGVKLVQLSDLIKKKFVEDFKDKNNYLSLNEQIDDMVARYLMKLLPLSHRLNLPTYTEIPGIELEVKGDIVGKIDGLTIEEAILKIIYAKTHMMFYNTYEYNSMIVPLNLRELLNLLSMLTSMQSLHNITSDQERSDIKRKNREKFRHYFVESWCLDKLSSKQCFFIKEVENCDATNINKFIIDYLYREYETIFRDEKCKIDKAIVNLHNRGYNVSIADVYYILDHLIGIDESSIKRLVFAIKTIYSIRLYDAYYEMMSQESLNLHSKLLADYQINSTVYKAINKNNHLFDYEKMIGGNILYIDRNKQCQYAGVASTSIPSEIYSEIITRYESLSDKSYKQIQSSIDANIFNVFEFFLLSTIYYSNPLYARTHKLCHYNSFPVRNYPSTGEFTFNFTSIISNIIRYYNLYRKYKNLADYNVNYNNKSFNTFFDIVHKLEHKSLIYKIINEVSKKTDDKHEAIEDVSIHNIEVLELLEDYLGNVNKLRHTQGNDENFNRILKFIKDLSDFRYYRYTGDTQDIYKDLGYKCISVIYTTLNEMDAKTKEMFCKIYNSSSYEKPSSNNPNPIPEAKS
jgi:signal recognition particle GTPase